MKIARIVQSALVALSSLCLAAGCGSGGGTTNPGGSDLAVAAVDMAAAPPDLAKARDLSRAPDLTEIIDVDGGGDCSIVGTWEIQPDFPITLDAQGVLSIRGQAAGKYTFTGNTFGITDDSTADCMMQGKYTLTFSARCDSVTAKPIADPCVPRQDALTMQAWVRQ